MYIRFVVDDIDDVSQERLGVFHAIKYLREDSKLTSYEEKLMDEVIQWFSDNLKKPDRLSKATRKNPADKAISWFKDTAREHINKIREVITVLEEHGIKVETIKTERPGYIVYEDVFQVSAEPFKETET